jgi:hypothetical protein
MTHADAPTTHRGTCRALSVAALPSPRIAASHRRLDVNLRMHDIGAMEVRLSENRPGLACFDLIRAQHTHCLAPPRPHPKDLVRRFRPRSVGNV